MVILSPYNSLLNGSTSTGQLRAINLQVRRLQWQLNTGLRAETFGQLPNGRRLDVLMRGQFAKLDSFETTFKNSKHLFELKTKTLERIIKIADEQRQNLPTTGLLPDNFDADHLVAGVNVRLNELINLLNSEVDGRFMFSGLATKTKPVGDLNTILNGQGAKAGLKQAISERRMADRGSDGLARLAISTAGGKVELKEQAAPFGMKITGVAGTVGGFSAAFSATGGVNKGEFNFGASVKPGDAVTITFSLPDGSSEHLRLRATTTDQPSDLGTFKIGKDGITTAANFRAKLEKSLKKIADTALIAASAFAAGQEFFALTKTKLPQRVSGPDFAKATALQNGKVDDTYFWYRGDSGGNNARKGARLQVDDALVVNYGVQANELGTRSLLADMAVFAAMDLGQPATPGGTTATNKELFAAMAERLRTRLSSNGNVDQIKAVAVEIAQAQKSAQTAVEFNTKTKETYYATIHNIETVNRDSTGVALLALTQQIKASYQLTKHLSQLSLVDIL